MPGKKGRPAGSLRTGEPAFLAAGRIRRPHGVRGDVLVEVITDRPARLAEGRTVHLGDGRIPLMICRQKKHKDGLVLGFDGYETPEAVSTFRNQILYVTLADAPPLAAGEYYHHQLLGLDVLSDDGSLLGHLSEIIETRANDVYVVQTETGGEILLPATLEVILSIDLNRGRMTVHLLPGLVAEEQAH